MSMLTATEIMDYQESLSLSSYRTIDQFLLSRWGIDYNRLPFYHELKSALENTMKRTESVSGYQWIDKY